MNPFSAIYLAATAVRNQLYDRGTLRARRLSAPVISVGSISAGGAGKTPFVILLGELLKQRGITFDVLSRGYGRKSRGACVVNPNGLSHEFGDEPLLIARRLECPVVVGESRYEAGLLAELKFGAQLHILDDGFQHRSLARDFNSALVTAKDLNDQLLPAGRLREPLGSLLRADAVVLSGQVDRDILPHSIKRVWQVRRRVAVNDTPQSPVVFCGVARPQDFLEQLKAKGVSPIAFKVFRDHHAYSPKDVQELIALRDENHSAGFITTEKDVINLGSALPQLGTVAIAKVVMELVEPADALDTILTVIAERRRKA